MTQSTPTVCSLICLLFGHIVWQIDDLEHVLYIENFGHSTKIRLLRQQKMIYLLIIKRRH